MKVFLLFLDGVGLGSANPDVNPLARASLPVMKGLFGGRIPTLDEPVCSGEGGIAFGMDANLGVDGLPQSGTGQATIFTGLNAAREFGSHFGPYIPTGLRQIVSETSLFSVLQKNGRSASFANAFPAKFFEYTQSGTRRVSAIVFSVLAAGHSLRTADDLSRGEAVSADFVRDRWPELGHPAVTPVTTQEAGRHCARLIDKNDLTVFDYWLPDHAGHGRSMDQAVEVLERLDGFLEGVIAHVDLADVCILCVSDHGNVEDLTTRSHTRNPVFSFIVGRRRNEVDRLTSLTDIAPFVYGCLNVRSPIDGG